MKSNWQARAAKKIVFFFLILQKSLEVFRKVSSKSGRQKIYNFFGMVLKSLIRLWTIWTISVQSGRFPDSLEYFQIVWRISGQSD